jgi:glycine/sarcosine N-methyltransferase
VTDPYHGLAADYDWIFDDGALAGGAAINRPAIARLLQRIGPASDVLDAACGTGIDAAVLARRGFNVRAADGSEAMVQAAAARFRREGLAIRVQRCWWADLPTAIDERFDVVLCTGNALVHAVGRDAMVQALIGLRRMARPGGHVVVDSRNWEKLHVERRVVQVMDGVKVRGGRRCVMLYAGRYRITSTGSTSPTWCSCSRTATGSNRTNTGSRSTPSRWENCVNDLGSPDCGKSTPTTTMPRTVTL